MCLIISIDGGATVIQRRVDGSVEFHQTWKKYEQGFGDLESEYFNHLPKPYTIQFRLFSLFVIYSISIT